MRVIGARSLAGQWTYCLRDHWPVETGSVDALIAEGRDAFERGDAEASRHAFEAALAERERGEPLEGLARSLYLEADYAGSIEAHTRAFGAYKEEGDALSAARAARILSWLHVNVYGDFAVAAGWLARAEELLGQTGEESAERGWVELMHAAREPHGTGRVGRLAAALDVGRRVGDEDLRFAALARLGEALVMTGRVEEGMLCFDESLAAVCGGEVRDLYVVESVFCGMFLTCERVHDVVRAEQWLRAAGELVRRRNLLAVGPLCRAHYGGLLTAAGRWDEAEAELGEAARVFEGGYLKACAALAEGRVRLASRSGDAQASLRQALEAFSSAQMPVELAGARLELARAMAREQPEVAMAEAKSALEAFELRQAARDADAAAALLRSLGGPGRSAPKRRLPLTNRESEVLELLGHGLSNPEIAERLFISRKTAEAHVGHILSKLDLRNRAEAAAYAARMAGEKRGSE